MSNSEEVLTVFRKYWKTLIKWILHIHGLPEITVDKLYNCMKSEQPPLLIDIRSTTDFKGVGDSKYGHIPNSISIPILELESKLDDLGSYKDKEIVTMCPGGGLSLAAVEILIEAGFKDVKSLKGGTDLWNKKGYPTTRDQINVVETTIQDSGKTIKGNENAVNEASKVHKTLDARGLTCPMPMLKSRVALKDLQINQVLEIRTTDPGSIDSIPKWAIAIGQELVASEELGPDDYRFLVRRLK